MWSQRTNLFIKLNQYSSDSYLSKAPETQQGTIMCAQKEQLSYQFGWMLYSKIVPSIYHIVVSVIWYLNVVVIKLYKENSLTQQSILVVFSDTCEWSS